MGHQGLVKFAAEMDMPPPMNKNAYIDAANVLKEAAQTVAEKACRKLQLKPASTMSLLKMGARVLVYLGMEPGVYVDIGQALVL